MFQARSFQEVMPVTLIKGDKHGSNVDYRDYLPVNVSGVLKPVLDAQGYMYQQPGLTQYATGTGTDRGGVWNERQQNHFRVSGGSFIEVATNGTVNTIGAIGGTDQASLPYSFNTQAIIANGRMWLYDGVTLSEITDPELGNPIDGVWVDGYYFLTDGENIYHTQINDESLVDPLQFATSEYSPDPTVGLGLTTDNKVIVFNRYTVEYFINTANENFAFTRVPSRAVKYGLVATHAKCEIGGQYFFLGGPKEGQISVYALGIGQAKEVAGREVTRVLQQYDESDLTEAVMESRVIEDYQYLILHLPNEVLLCNLKLSSDPNVAWSILKSDVPNDTPWRGLNGVFEASRGEWVYGDKLDNTIGFLDESVATHYGNLAECILYTPFVYLEEMSIDELEIFTIPGFNSVDDATVAFSITYDGVTHSMENFLQYGPPGDYAQRFISYRLGYVDNWFAFKFRWASTSRMCFSLLKIHYG